MAVSDPFIAGILVAGLLLIAVGVLLWSVPAGLVTAGGELVVTAYSFAYIKARGVAK